MSKTLTSQLPQMQRRSAQESKAENTTRIAREMIDAEVNSRESKTAKLRKARLAREAEEADEAARAAPAAGKKAATKKKAAPKPPAG